MKIMASSSITSWQINGETMGIVTDFLFWGSKITAYGDCSQEIKRCLLLGRKVMTNLDSILKSRDITLPTKAHLVKAVVFPVVMYGCESWTIKKAEHWRINSFKLWCWRRLLRVSWTARRSNQSILRKSALNIHWKDRCWSWNSNTSATWCEELTHLKRLWCWERLNVGEERDDRGWDGWMASPTQWTWVWVNSGSWWWTRRPGVLQSMGSQRVRHNWATELNWGFHICIGTTEEYNYFKIPQYLAVSLLSGEIWIFTVLDRCTVNESLQHGCGEITKSQDFFLRKFSTVADGFIIVFLKNLVRPLWFFCLFVFCFLFYYPFDFSLWSLSAPTFREPWDALCLPHPIEKCEMGKLYGRGEQDGGPASLHFLLFLSEKSKFRLFTMKNFLFFWKLPAYSIF